MLDQLVLVGKMREDEMHSAPLVLGGGLLCGLGWMAVKYVAWLRPEWRRLDALIAQYK